MRLSVNPHTAFFLPVEVRTASDALAVDTDQTKGQVRGIRAAFVSELVKQMEANHPQDLLELTVWLDQGALRPPTSMLWW